MSDQTRVATPVSSARGGDAATDTGSGQRRLAFGLFVAVVVLDQATKWWAWRYAPAAYINPGTTWGLGRPLNGWLSAPGTGGVLDVVDLGLLSLARFVLLRRRRGTVVLVTGALMIAGWGSNLLDRLGMHGLTAPGSIRGAVDWIPLGRPFYNLADFVIIGATAVFLVAVCLPGYRRNRSAAPSRELRRPAAPALAETEALGTDADTEARGGDAVGLAAAYST